MDSHVSGQRREVDLPPTYAALRNIVRYVQKPTFKEYSSSCPKCGGEPHNGEWPDRFRMFTTGKPRGWCRRCGYLWFPDMANPNFRPDERMMRQWQDEREAEARRTIDAANHSLLLLQQERKWEGYHQCLADNARAIQWFEDQSITSDWRDYWKVGYTPDKAYKCGDQLLHSPAYTIPKFGLGWQIKNIDYRLEQAPPEAGRYRPMEGLPAAAFISLPDEDRMRDEVYVVEGSKKAMVVTICNDSEPTQVIGVPGCQSWAGMDVVLRSCGRVWVIFDPDATKHAVAFAKSVGPNARVVELFEKPDDALLKYMDSNQWKQALRQAVKV